jgi:hypothetical protein
MSAPMSAPMVDGLTLLVLLTTGSAAAVLQHRAGDLP